MKVAGFGFRQNATVDSLRDALAATGVSGIDAIATVAEKANAPVLTDFADACGVPVRSVPKADLPKADVATQSEKSEKLFGTGSLSEAAALIAAGPRARLIAVRAISPDRMASCAVAESEGA